MNKIIVPGMLILSVVFTACDYYGPCLNGTGPVISEVRDISDFTGVSNNGSFDVFVTQSDEFDVEVVAQGNLIPIIKTHVSGNTLRIETKNGTCYRSDSPVEIYVSLPELELLALSGSGEVVADVADAPGVKFSNSGSGQMSIETVVAGELAITNSGSGKVEILESTVNELRLVQSGSGTIHGGTIRESANVSIRHSSSGRVRASVVNGSMVDAILSGSGNIDLDGEISSAEYTLNSSGRIDALELEAAEVNATITGSGRIFVWATEILEATITGSGDVIYRGQPAISFQITGSGKVRPY